MCEEKGIMEETKKRTRKATVAKETKTAEKASTAKKSSREKKCGKEVCSSETGGSSDR